MKQCLNEVLKYGGPFSPRDLYPVRRILFYLCPILLILLQYQLALHQIESLRRDGKFHSPDGSIPEGQGIVMAHLNECHELIEMVRLLDRSQLPCSLGATDATLDSTAQGSDDRE